MVPVEYVRKALEHYRKPDSKSRSLRSMENRFRFIKTTNDISQLRKFEENEQACINRQMQLTVLCDRLREIVFHKMNEGISLHDVTLQAIA